MKKKEKLKNKEPLDKRKIFGTIIGGIIFLCCILFFTYAWYEWRSETNTTVVFDIVDGSKTCENGPDVSVSNIGPVLDYNDGVGATFKVGNSSAEDATFIVNLNITSITDNLLVDSFKYILLKDNFTGTSYEEIGISGSFTDFEVGTNVISDSVPIEADSSHTYKLIVYIDGTVYNDTSMQEGSMNAGITIGECDILGTVTNVSLSEVAVGSYVSYTGDNGCDEEHCNGNNANYVSDTSMGYCSSSSYKFSVNGWRVGYIEDDTAYLVSAGAPECLKTYAESKTDSTETRNFVESLTYNTGTSVTGLSSTTLSGTVSTYTFPDDLDSLNGKYTCGYESTSSCGSTYYSVTTSSSSRTLTLNKKNISSSSCTNSTTTSSSNFKNCLLASYVRRGSTGSYTYSGRYYYGTSYTRTGNKYQLSGTTTLGTPSSSKYTCKSSSSSTTTCSELYRITSATAYQSTGTSSTLTGCRTSGNSEYCYYYGSYTKYTISSGTSITYSPSDDLYLYGSGYEFNESTGEYVLTDTSSLSWASGYDTIMNSKKYTCFSSSGTCSTMYEITSDSTSSQAVYYTYTSERDSSSHITRMDDVARKYCNPRYAYNGVCDDNSAWAFDATDFEKITGSQLYYTSSSNKSCYAVSSSTACGYGNTLISNGGYYWYGTIYGTSTTNLLIWSPSNKYVGNNTSSYSYGVRPVLRIDSSVRVIGGSGTYSDPYVLSVS